MQRHILWAWVSTTLLSAVMLFSLSLTSPVEASLGDLIDVPAVPSQHEADPSIVQEGPLDVMAIPDDIVPGAAADLTVSDDFESYVLLEAIAHAGFSGVTSVVPIDGKFQSPTRYFRVAEGNASGPWAEDANLLAVLVYKPTNQSLLATSPRRVTYVEFAGRFQGRFSKDEYYVAVTGPDLQKVSNLVKLLEGAELGDYEYEETYGQKPVVE